MTRKRSRYSTCVAEKKGYKGQKMVRYLSKRDEQKGIDISLDMHGWKIRAL